MREILFRGKQVDSGEWIYGFLNKIQDIGEKSALLKFCIDYEEKGVMYSAIVDPETIGQYTGQDDKNGKRIFEGDICTIATSNIADDEYGVVKYDERDAAFIIDFGTYEISFLVNINSSDVEIVGNVHNKHKPPKGKGEIGNDI